MLRDMLGNRFKKQMRKEEEVYLEKFYIYKNRVIQIVRLYIQDKVRRHNNEPINCEIYYTTNGRKVKKIVIPYTELQEKTFYNTFQKAERKLKNRKDTKWNYCFFENNDIKIVNELYKLGYKNYSRHTSISYHNTPCSVILNGLLMTVDDTKEVLLEKYRLIKVKNDELAIIIT